MSIGRLRKFLSSATVRITLARPRRVWTRLNSLVSPVSSVVSARVMRAVSRDGFNPGTEAAGPINPGQNLGFRVPPALCEVCAFELIRINRQDGIGCLREPFASARRLENNEQRDRQQNQNRKRAEVKLSQFLFIDLAGKPGQLCLML